MKSFVLLLPSFAILFLLNCKKESGKKFKPSEVSIQSARIDSTPDALPYYLRYQIYRKDFNSLYINFTKKESNEGC